MNQPMFTGLVEGTGIVTALVDQPPGQRVEVRCESLVAGEVRIGDSIAVNGCCLTLIAESDGVLAFEAGPETLRRTNLGQLLEGVPVNFERSLRAGDPLGGHLVTGHVDGVGQLDARHDEREWSTIWFRAPQTLTRQMASKGSIAVDGVSLTLVDVERERFSVALIPHTLQVTTLGQRTVGDAVNLETDLLAKYVERQMVAAAWSKSGNGES